MPPIAVSLIASRAGAQAAEREKQHQQQQHYQQQQQMQNPIGSNAGATGYMSGGYSTQNANPGTFSLPTSSSSSSSTTVIPSSFGASDEDAADGIHGIDRKILVSTLKRRARRARQCRTLPLSIVLYAMFIWSMFVHVDVAPSFDIERGLLDSVVGTFSPYTGNDWRTWLTDSFLPYILPQVDIAGNPLPSPIERSFLLEYGVVVGGVRITQRRGKDTECVLPTLYPGVYPFRCHSFDTLSSNTAGGYGPFTYNSTQAEIDGIRNAFLPFTLTDDPKGAGFHWFVSAYEDISTSIAEVQHIVTSGWLDRYTSALTVGVSILNPEVGYIVHLEYDASITRGGRIESKTTLTSMALNPYLMSPGVAILDIIVVLYFVYLFLGTSKRVARILIQKGLTRTQRVLRLCSWGSALDWGTVAAMIAAIVTWGEYFAKITQVRTLLTNYHPLVPLADDDGMGTNAAAYTTALEGVFPASFADIQQAVTNAAIAHATFKESAIWALIFLSLRMYKYVGFQARLAVLTVTLTRALNDMIHFGILFIIMFVCYGVWGHFAFGPQVPGYADSGISITSLFRFLMYDYDLDAMRLSSPSTADLYYASYMMLMTNLMLWMFLAVIFENYTVVRTSAGELPSFSDEMVAFWQALPRMVPAWASEIWGFLQSLFSCNKRKKSGMGGGGGGGGGGGTGMQGRDTITWAEVIKVCTKGPLKGSAIITAEKLRMHLGVSEASAHLLIADIASSPPGDNYYGNEFKGGRSLPDGMRLTLVRLYPHLFPDVDLGGLNDSGIAGPMKGYSSRGDDDEDDDNDNTTTSGENDEFDEEEELDPGHPSIKKRIKKFWAFQSGRAKKKKPAVGQKKNNKKNTNQNKTTNGPIMGTTSSSTMSNVSTNNNNNNNYTSSASSGGGVGGGFNMRNLVPAATTPFPNPSANNDATNAAATNLFPPSVSAVPSAVPTTTVVVNPFSAASVAVASASAATSTTRAPRTSYAPAMIDTIAPIAITAGTTSTYANISGSENVADNNTSSDGAVVAAAPPTVPAFPPAFLPPLDPLLGVKVVYHGQAAIEQQQQEQQLQQQQQQQQQQQHYQQPEAPAHNHSQLTRASSAWSVEGEEEEEEGTN